MRTAKIMEKFYLYGNNNLYTRKEFNATHFRYKKKATNIAESDNRFP